MNRLRWILLAAIALLIIAFFAFGLGAYFSPDALRSRYAELRHLTEGSFGAAATAYVASYALLTAINLPVAAALTITGGAIFGLLWGTVLASIASSIGATLSFLAARFLFRAAVERRFTTAITRVNEGVERDGAYYLFAVRLVPIFPFFVVNAGMALTRMQTFTFYWVSQVAMLPGTLVYVNAGRELGRAASTAHVMSPGLIASFVVLGVFPLAAHRALGWFSARRRLRPFVRPRRFERNLVVIGGGSAGLVSAYIAASAGARVTLIEQDRMGGDCLNTGCVPSKALIQSARVAETIRRAGDFGLVSPAPGVDFGAVMRRVARIIERIEPHDSVGRYTALGVECLKGRAELISPWEVATGGGRLTTRAIIIATGGHPAIPRIKGLDKVAYLTSDTIWGLETLPRHLVVLGGGAIGCELAQAFRRLGSEVVVVEALPRVLAREDPDVSAALAASLGREGIEVVTSVQTESVSAAGLVVKQDGATRLVPFDQLLVATGRRATTAGLGLERLGIELNSDGTIKVDAYMQSSCPNVYACGDVAGPYQLTHVAAHQAWHCTMNALLGGLWRFPVRYSAIPAVTFTDPEIARVGLNESEATARGVQFEVSRYGIEELDRAIADGKPEGFIKALTPPGSDRLLGVTIAGPQAGELIAEFALAMHHGLGLRKVLGTVHAYPTLAEANRFVAGEWRRAHLPAGLLRLAGRYHAWRLR